jgi:ferredoxin
MMIVSRCSQAFRNSSHKVCAGRLCAVPHPDLLKTQTVTTSFGQRQPHPRYFSRTVHVKNSTVETPMIMPTAASTILDTSESVNNDEDVSKVETVSITFVESDGTEKTVPAEVGKHLLDVAHDNRVDLEGACGGELSCSTCHLIFEPHVYETLPPKKDEEQDMLDLAYAVTETYVSSYSCSYF